MQLAQAVGGIVVPCRYVGRRLVAFVLVILCRRQVHLIELFTFVEDGVVVDLARRRVTILDLILLPILPILCLSLFLDLAFPLDEVVIAARIPPGKHLKNLLILTVVG